MSNAIYIATNQPYSGKSVMALGLLNMLSGKTKKVAYFKPIIYRPNEKEADAHIQMIAAHFKINTPYEEMYAFTREEVLQHRAVGNDAFVIDTIIEKFKKLEEENDFVVVEGTDFLKDGVSYDFDANLVIAKNLGIPVIILVSADKSDDESVVNNLLAVCKSFGDKDIQVLAAVINKTGAEKIDSLKALLKESLPKEILLSIIPADKNLDNPTMKEITESIGGTVLLGKESLSNQVDHSIVGAMQLNNLLLRLKPNTLIVTPGDRGDIILAAMQANISSNYPKVAGLILTGGLKPDEPIMRVIEGLDTVIPVVEVQTGTFETVTNISKTPSRISVDNSRKISLAINTFDKYVNAAGLEEKIKTFHTSGITPHMFQYQMVKRAKSHKKHIVLAEGNDDRILTAAAKLLQQDIVTLTILGDKEEINSAMRRLNLSFPTENLTIINPLKSNEFERYAETLYELRKAKHVTLEMARDMMGDVSYYGTMMVYLGEADGMVSGAVHTTQHTIRPALQFVKTKPGINTVSSIFFMCLEDRVSVFGDCAVNPNPTAEQLAEIAISAAESSIAFGIEPLIAMLSYSSGTSGVGEDVDKVRTATELVRKLRPDLKVEGPIQYDAAVDPVVGKQKMPNSPVAGQASVLIFPDLNTGNNTYKAVQRETGALAIGPMLQGLNKPVNDLSRGCTIEDIFNTVVITAIQAQ